MDWANGIVGEDKEYMQNIGRKIIWKTKEEMEGCC
jgi:hypothetical protein